MASHAPDHDRESLTGCQLAILDAVQRNFTYVADVLDYCGPRFEEEDRGFDSSAYTIEVDELIRGGYLERSEQRGMHQLELELTDLGSEAAPPLPSLDRDLLDEYGVDTQGLRILYEVDEYIRAEGSPPSITDIQSRIDDGLSAYQYTLQFNNLVKADLAVERGILRYRIEPTEAGREVLAKYGEHL